MSIRMIRMPKYKYYFAISDIMILSVSFIVSAYVITLGKKPDITGSILSIPELFLFIVLSSSIIYAFEKNNLYKVNVILKKTVHITILLKSLLFAAAITSFIFILFFSESAPALSLITFLYVFSASFLFYLLRIEFYRRMILKIKNNFFRRKIIIVGAGRWGRKMASVIASENPYGVNIIGFLDDFKSSGIEVEDGKKVLGKIEQTREIALRYQPDEIIIAINKISYERLLQILDYFKGIDVSVKLASENFDVITKKFATDKYGNIPVTNITPTTKNDLDFILKRFIDFTGALAGLIVLSPLLIIVILLIKLGSPGPIFFTQTRIGQNGKPFTFYKFRSMYVIDGEDEERKKMMIDFMKNNRSQAEDTKIINDKRVTWVGKFIRRTSIDELPQLYNVLKGDMSLVGPRPCLPYEYENYDNWQKRRVEVLPGCTGVWQISGRSSVSFNDSVLLDMYYINNLSLSFDIKILLKTLPVMFFSKGGK